jgi:cytochrome P450
MRETTTMTVQVISKVAFGNEPVTYFYSEQFYEDVGITFRVVLEDAMFHLPRWVWKLTPMYKTELLAREGNARLEDACMEVVTRTRQQYATLSEEDKKHTHSLIDIMIRQEGVTDAEILANVKTFYLAGSDTTSVSMSWAMFLLVQHPAVVARMREEVRGLFAQPLREMSAQAIAELLVTLPYSTAVFKEAVRLYPVGPLIFLDFMEDEPLTLSDGMVIDSDKTLMLHAWACHFDEEYFPNAHAFDPARWLTADKEALGRMDQAFLGFGGGTRACPGMGLALSEGVVGIAAVVHHVDFELACPVEDVQVLYKFTMQPSQLPMRVTRRKV